MMSVEYSYDEERNLLHTRFFGVVKDEDLRRQAHAVASDKRIQPEVRELVDLRGIEKVEASPSAFEDIILSDRSHSQKFRGMRTAIVAPTDALYRYSRVFESLAEMMGSPATVKAFRTVHGAQNWLGLRETEI